MGVKTLVSVLAVASYCQGAAIFSDTDEWFDAAQNFLMDPEPLVTALGAQRVKRDAAYDQEFTLAALGVGFGMKYTDAANPMKGGKAYARFPLKKFAPKAHSETVDLRMSFDGGDAVDGLFTMSVDYTLTHSDGDGEEKGTFTVSRKKTAGLWKTEISTSSGGAFPHRLIPLFSISAESDRKTKISGIYKGTYGSLTLNIDRVPGEKLAAEIDFNGKKYSFAITLNKAAMSADIVINAAGQEYKLTAKVSNESSWKISVTGDVMGPVDASVLVKKDYTEAKIEVSHKNAKLLQMRLKGNRKSDGSFKSKAKFSLLGGKVATGEIDASYADNKFNIVLKPNNMDDIDLTVYMKPSYNGNMYSGAAFGYEAKKGGEPMLKYDGVHKRTNDASKYDASLKTELQLSEKSLLYPTFCKIGNAVGSGCFKSRKMELTAFVDKVNKNKLMNKFSFGLKNIKDGETRLEATISTLQNPYQLKIVSPLLQDKIGSKEFTITADHQPGKQLTVTSSFQQFKFFFKHGPIADGRNYFAEISKAGVSFLKYDLNLTFKKNPSALNMGLNSQFDVNEASLFYPLFCNYGSGCFKQRKADISIFVDMINKNALINKFDIHVNLLKDDEKVVELEVCTKHTPYKFILKAPYVLPKMIGQPSVEVEALHKLGQSLEVTTNFAKAKSFSVKTTSGNMREVKFNGKLLFKGEITKGNKSFKQQLELANGKSMALTVSWKNDVLDASGIMANDVKLNLAGNKVNADVEVEWDVSNPSNGEFEIEAKGTGRRLGQFEFKRKVDWNCNGNNFIASIIGKSSSEKGWFAEKGLNPVDTKINVDFDYNNMNLNANMVKVVAGKRYAVAVKDNNLDFSF
eukprot:TRINITY_DN2775_c0_g1_i2.p1 TRINITY_DN2775_c0_g1~~TRINITY_DN2775_c0_g1_i2.p1  ORF type:complete len:864 (-),score=245.27 TRINITY_DN2775_c0_g1_i2:151-2718(-)